MDPSARTHPLVRGPALPSHRPTLKFRVAAGPDEGRAGSHSAERVTVGRGETADVRLSDRAVSLFHAELIAGDSGVLVVDLGSRNGTRALGVEIERATVPWGATLEVGSSALVLERGDVVESPADEDESFGALLGEAPVMRGVCALLRRLAPTDLSVCLGGETGTGKELAARALHERSRRARGPFIVLDCAAIPTTLAASVLFGYEKGAFTGATERRIGVFEAAHGGTLFLDEVGELPLEVQASMLGVLQRREVVAVGRTQPRAIDVRIVSATWRNLRSMVNDGRFREDLYYRLAQASVRMPSLGERREDVGLLVHHFLAALPRDVRAARAISGDSLAAVAARNYPGNVRELKSTVERLAMLADGPMITASDLAFERMLAAARDGTEDSASDSPPGMKSVDPAEDDDDAPAARRRSSPDAAAGEIAPFKEAKRTLVDEFERAYLVRLLERTGGNVSRAAMVAGLQRHNFRQLLKKHDLHTAAGA